MPTLPIYVNPPLGARSDTNYDQTLPMMEYTFVMCDCDQKMVFKVLTHGGAFVSNVDLCANDLAELSSNFNLQLSLV